MNDADYCKLLATELPNMKIEGCLGKGGQGLVFCAENDDGRRLACKVLFSGSADDAERFKREIEILSDLDHPNIVPITHAGILPGDIPFFLMPLLDGFAIDEHCTRGRHPVDKRVELFLQICDGLAYAHAAGVIHRDIKSGNVIIDKSNGTPHGRACVVDFGMAELSGERRDLKRSSAWRHVGTLAYMSPEQVDDGTLDLRTDIYSLGVLMYEVLSEGRFPIPINSIGPTRVRRHIRETEPPSLRGVNPAIDARLSSIVHKCMEKDRTRRYSSMDKLREDLKRWQDGKPVKARADSRWHHMKKFARRHKWPLAMAATVMLLLIAGSISTTVMWQRADDAAASAQAAAERAEGLATTYSAGLAINDLVQRGSEARDEGRAAEALALWREALELDAAAPVRNAEIDRMRYEALHRLCEFHMVDKHAELARVYCADALAVAEQYADHPDRGWQRRAGFSEILRGRLALADRDYEAALMSFGHAVQITRDLGTESPEIVRHQVDLAHALALAGRACRKLGRMAEALGHYTEAYDVRLELYEAHPETSRRSIELLHSEAKLAVWHIVQKTADDNRRALEWIIQAEDRLAGMQTSGMCDDHFLECRRFTAALAKNRSIIERRSGRTP